jgi:hypothetical protein
MPFPLPGIGSDNGGEFINEQLLRGNFQTSSVTVPKVTGEGRVERGEENTRNSNFRRRLVYIEILERTP